MQQKQNRLIFILLFVFFAELFFLGAWRLIVQVREYDKGVDIYQSLAHSAVKETEVETMVFDEEQAQKPQEELDQLEAQQEQPATSQNESKEETDSTLSVDFDMLRALNSHSIAWIQSGDGKIDYPVVQGSDNDYYLDHLFDGTQNSSGAIFVDFRNSSDFSDRNTLIYGHNMRNGSMFASLLNYADEGYLNAYPQLLLVTPEAEYHLQIIAGYTTRGDSDIYQLNFSGDEEFLAYVEKIKLLSDFSSDVTVSATDRLVTLSTCTYAYDDARYVLHCKLAGIG